MTLDEFITEELDRVQKFKKSWEKAHETHPDEFPLVLDPGQWDEQLNVFDEGGRI